jgi:hypothetical protein
MKKEIGETDENFRCTDIENALRGWHVMESVRCGGVFKG